MTWRAISADAGPRVIACRHNPRMSELGRLGRAPSAVRTVGAGAWRCRRYELPRSVVVWRFRIDVRPARVAIADAGLSPSDRAWADRASLLERPRRMVRRAVLRAILSDELGLPEPQLRLERRSSGEPWLANPEAHNTAFSASSSGRVGVVSIAPASVIGVDLERIAHWNPDVMDEGWLHPDEVTQLRSIARHRRGLAVATYWTRKEAIAKALGVGLHSNFAAMDCTLSGPGVTADGLALSTFATRTHAMSVAVSQ